MARLSNNMKTFVLLHGGGGAAFSGSGSETHLRLEW